MIDYLVPSFFLDTATGHSGGMHTKIERVRRAAGSLYKICVGSDLSEMRSDFLLIEPLYFRMSDTYDLEELRAHDAKKILYCSEMEVFRWTGGFRKELLEICDAVTANCDYQENLFKAVGIEHPHRLIDPIPADEFQPLPKKLQVVSMGLISEIKGSPFIAELFKALAPTPMETVYVGGAGLWSVASEANLALESEIREYTDVFYQNILPEFVPKAIGASAFFVGATIHDVSACCHAEALMSGCITIGGDHPIYSERPVFYGANTVETVLSMLKQLTNDFKRPPSPQLSEQARDWAVAHLSFEVFVSQLTALLKDFYE